MTDAAGIADGSDCAGPCIAPAARRLTPAHMELGAPDVPLVLGPFPLLPEPPLKAFGPFPVLPEPPLAFGVLAEPPPAFGQYPPGSESTPPPRSQRSLASRRLLVPQGSSGDLGAHAHAHSPPPPAGTAFPFFGGGIGPSVGANWPPSRRREEATVLKNLERRVGSFRVNLRTSCGDLLEREPCLEKDRVHVVEDKTEPDVPDNRLPLLRKILSHRPLVVNNNNEADTEWYTSDFITECLCWHNVYRQRHGVPPLSMCPDLCSYAQEWANTLAHTNTFRYRNYCRDLGQNIYCRLSVKDPAEVAGQQVASYWYSACRHYDYLKEPDVLHVSVNTGHFTQLVWASTCDVGIGIARSRGGKVMVVAHYRPVGNTSGGFTENVPPPVAEVSSDVSSEYS